MSNSKPLISVIITNYNYGAYITDAINSILEQTYPNIELIIINDGSTDNSDKVIKSILKSNTDKDIRYISRANKGVVYSRNEGIEIAKGEYICYLDADDYFNDDYISKNYEVARIYDAGVVYPNWHFVGEWLGRPDTNFPEFKPKLLQLQKLHVTPASLIRKSAIGNNRFEAEKVAEDWDFFIGLSLNGVRFKLAKDNYINYRIRQGTRGSKNSPEDDTKYFVEILEKYREKYGDEVIEPSRLISLRHPGFIKRVLSRGPLIAVKESVQKDGIRITSRKILRKIMSRMGLVWRVVWHVRNRKYERLVQSQKIVNTPKVKLAVVIHLYYPDLWPVIAEALARISTPFDLFVSIKAEDKDLTIKRVSKYHKATNTVVLPNRGRDVLPFMIIAKEIRKARQYSYILKLHTKKSPHRKDGDEWLNSLLTELIPDDVSAILEVLKKSKTGAAGPSSHVVSLSRYMGSNKQRISDVMLRFTDQDTVDNILDNTDRYPFFGGTMFWCRVDFLNPLLDSGLMPADFNSESGQVDGTTAHALERILGRTLHAVSNKKMYVINGASVRELPEKSYTSTYRHVG